MQLLVKGTRRIIFILCAVSDAKRYYSSPLKLATLQTSLKHVRRSAHNADFCRLSISKHPANAHKINIIRRWDSQWGSGSKVVGGGAYCLISLIW